MRLVRDSPGVIDRTRPGMATGRNRPTTSEANLKTAGIADAGTRTGEITMARTINRTAGTQSAMSLRSLLSLVWTNGLQPTTFPQVTGLTGKPSAIVQAVCCGVADRSMSVDEALVALGDQPKPTPPAPAAPKKTAAELFREFQGGKITEAELTAALERLTVRAPAAVKPLAEITMTGEMVDRCIRDAEGNLIREPGSKKNQKHQVPYTGKPIISIRGGKPIPAWTVYAVRKHMAELVKALEAKGFTEAEARKDSTGAAALAD